MSLLPSNISELLDAKYSHLSQRAFGNDRVQRAILYAIEAHDSIKQVRKYTGEPYWVHILDVADIVASVGGSDDQIIAALLHDVLEDVTPKNSNFNEDSIRQRFGNTVILYVIDLTDVYIRENYPKLNRKERKKLEKERVALTSPEVKTIKLADLISNTVSIVQYDKGFAKTYIKEKEAALPILMEGNSVLLARAGQQVWDAKGELGLFKPYIQA